MAVVVALVLVVVLAAVGVLLVAKEAKEEAERVAPAGAVGLVVALHASPAQLAVVVSMRRRLLLRLRPTPPAPLLLLRSIARRTSLAARQCLHRSLRGAQRVRQQMQMQA